jgi:ankyrin repeat protein
MKRSATEEALGHQDKKVKYSSLMEAVIGLDYDAVKMFLENGANPNDTEKGGDTPLQYISSIAWLQVNRLIRALTAPIEHSEILHSYLTAAGYILDNENTDMGTLIEKCKSDLRNILENQRDIDKHVQIAKLLLDNGADPNIQNYEKDTPLGTACMLNNVKMVKLLLKYNARVDLESSVFGDLPIHNIDANHLIRFSKKERVKARKVARLLLKHGADPDPDAIHHFLPRVAFREKRIDLGAGIFATLPTYLSTTFPNSKSVVHAQYRTKSTLKTIGFLSMVSKDRLGLPIEIEYLIGSFYVNLPYTTFCTVIMEEGRLDANITNLKERITKIYKTVKANSKYQHIKSLIENGGDINAPIGNNETFPLHYACQHLDVQMVKLLLEHGANPNIVRDKNVDYEMTPIISAMLTYLWSDSDTRYGVGKEEGFYRLGSIIDLLLKYGADLNIPSDHWNSIPIMFAIHSHDIKLVQLLLDKGVNPNIQIQDSFECNEGLIDDDVDHFAYACEQCEQGHTPLNFALAIDWDDEELISLTELLLSKGADPNITDYHEFSALDCALLSRYKLNSPNQNRLIELLLKNGANPNLQKSEYGFTPMHYMCVNDLDYYELFVQYGADINLKDDNGRTPLEISLFVCHSEKLESILKAGANPNQRDYKDRIILHRVIKNNDHNAMEILLKYGADPSLLGDTKRNEEFKLTEIPPYFLAAKFPEAKSCTQIQFQIENVCKTIGLFTCLSKNGFVSDSYLPQNVVYLIQTFCSNVYIATFAVVAQELKEVGTNIVSLKEKANTVFLNLKAKGEEFSEAPESAIGR